MMAGAKTRFPPMAVKLKGVTARTNPSRGRYSVRLWAGGKRLEWGREIGEAVYNSLPSSVRVPGRLDLVKLLNVLDLSSSEAKE
jgi:hypothetical protein